jgi:hypothetical protein
MTNKPPKFMPANVKVNRYTSSFTFKQINIKYVIMLETEINEEGKFESNFSEDQAPNDSNLVFMYLKKPLKKEPLNTTKYKKF